MYSSLERNRSIAFDGFTLKIIAIVAMAIDHAGYLFFDNFIAFRIIGRLTLPIMAFFITEGYRRTRDVKKYMLRLALFAVLSMLPYYLAFQYTVFNILFNLLFGLMVLYITDQLNVEWQKWCVVVFFAAAAFFLHMDGMYTAVPLIYLMNKYREDFKKLCIAVAILLFGISFIHILLGVTGIDPSFLTNIFTWIRPCALFSLFFIYGYNGQRGRGAKYLFYIFYPAHLLVLYGLALLF